MTVVLVPLVARYGTDAVFTVGVIAGALSWWPRCGWGGTWRSSPGRWSRGSPSGSQIIFLQQVPPPSGSPGRQREHGGRRGPSPG